MNMKTIKKLSKLVPWVCLILLVGFPAYLLDKKNKEDEINTSFLIERITRLEEATKSAEKILSSPVPVPSPEVIYKYIEKPKDDKLQKIDARIAEIEEEIKKVNKFLEENKYNQDAQARRRDLEAELGYLKIERIRYE